MQGRNSPPHKPGLQNDRHQPNICLRVATNAAECRSSYFWVVDRRSPVREGQIHPHGRVTLSLRFHGRVTEFYPDRVPGTRHLYLVVWP